MKENGASGCGGAGGTGGRRLTAIWRVFSKVCFSVMGFSVGPGIDVGDNQALPPDSLDADYDGDVAEPIPFDIAGNTRITDGGSGVATVDAGAFEYSRASTSVDDITLDRPRASGVTIDVYPNPTDSDATVVIRAGSGPVTGELVLYDVRGRETARLFNGVIRPGDRVSISAPKGLPAGFYILVFYANAGSVTVGMIKAR